MKDTFIEEWTKLNERLDNQNCQSLDVHDLDQNTHNLIIDSLYISVLPPFLGEPYSIPSASMSVLEYIEKNNESLFHPLMNTWISEPNDVFKKSPFQKISDINICSSVDRKADSIPEIPLKAFLSSVYENKSLFCIEIGLSHSTLGNACKYTYSIDILLFMNKKNLEVVEYGIGNSIGLPEKFESKVSVNY